MGESKGMKVLNVLNIVILLTICHFAFGDCRETSLLSKVVFLQENGLLNKQVRYEFQYNENGKVSEKKAFRWDRTNDEWVPFYQITYQYDDRSGEIKTNYGMWDKKKKNFSLNVQNMIIPSTNYEEIFS